jgi:hypothetical protein
MKIAFAFAAEHSRKALSTSAPTKSWLPPGVVKLMTSPVLIPIEHVISTMPVPPPGPRASLIVS